MATTHAPMTAPRDPQKTSAAPWIVFVVAMVLVLTAVLTAVLINLRPDDRDQANSALQLRLPKAPSYKMPPSPPVQPQ